MKNLLELSKRQIIAISTGAVAVGIAGILTVGIVMAEQMENANVTYTSGSNTPADVTNHNKTAATLDDEDAPSSAQSTPSETVPATQPKAPVAAQQPPKTNTPAASKPGVVSGTVGGVTGVVDDVKGKLEGGHIPFTNLPVVPGDPLSYIGTVGQCPFYEIVTEKGCWPPKDITCNADWTVCTYNGN